jgi:hypothetical protein
VGQLCNDVWNAPIDDQLNLILEQQLALLESRDLDRPQRRAFGGQFDNPCIQLLVFRL